jgi:hypothetical protein
VLVYVQLTLVVERATEGIDDAPEEVLADGDLEQAAGALDGVALDDLVPVPEEDDADVVGLEVQRQAGDVVRQLEHLERHAVVEAVDAGDAVGDRENGAHLGEVGAPLVHAADPLAQDAGDLVWLDIHLALGLLVAQAAWATSFLSFSSRPRTLASSTLLPTCRTMPPRISSSTSVFMSIPREV